MNRQNPGPITEHGAHQQCPEEIRAGPLPRLLRTYLRGHLPPPDPAANKKSGGVTNPNENDREKQEYRTRPVHAMQANDSAERKDNDDKPRGDNRNRGEHFRKSTTACQGDSRGSQNENKQDQFERNSGRMGLIEQISKPGRSEAHT